MKRILSILFLLPAFASAQNTPVGNPANTYTQFNGGINAVRLLKTPVGDTGTVNALMASSYPGFTKGGLMVMQAGMLYYHDGSKWLLTVGSGGGSITEVDPTVPSYVKAITTTNISNWNTAYGWGNHATAGYVPQARTLTINGTTYDLSANRSWTISGGGLDTVSGDMRYHRQGGDAYGAVGVFGTKDNYDLSIIRNGVTQALFTGGGFQYGPFGNTYLMQGNGIVTLQANGTGIQMTGALLNFYTAAGPNATLNGAGSFSTNLIYAGASSSTPAASAVLEANSTVRGFLPPRMTTTQRNAISSPAEGLQVYNTTTHRNAYFDGTQWQEMIANTSGVSTQSGNGMTATFSIPHGLMSTPSYVNAIANTADAGGIRYISADATNIYVNYDIAPPIGTNNLKWSWIARP